MGLSVREVAVQSGRIGDRGDDDGTGAHSATVASLEVRFDSTPFHHQPSLAYYSCVYTIGEGSGVDSID